MPNVIRTVIIDDEARALNRMKMLMNNFPDIVIVGQFNKSQDGLDFILKNEPELVFLDIEMPGKSGLELADEINKNFLKTKLIFITAFEHYAIKAIKNYAFDYLLKPVSIDELKVCIERFKAKLCTNLNKREFEVIRAIAEGLNSKAIAEKLFISRHTVDTYRRTILEKTACKNSAELIRYATKNNLI